MSVYAGGSAGLSPRDADTLHLNSGVFGTPVMLGELCVQYIGKGFGFKVLATAINIPQAQAINRSYGNNAAELIYGAYTEISYNLLAATNNPNKSLQFFSRYEMLDLNAKMPENGVKDDYVAQTYIVSGITFIPVRGVAIKADYVNRITGKYNPMVQDNPFGSGMPFFATSGYVNFGVAYSF